MQIAAFCPASRSEVSVSDIVHITKDWRYRGECQDYENGHKLDTHALCGVLLKGIEGNARLWTYFSKNGELRDEAVVTCDACILLLFKEKSEGKEFIDLPG